MTPSFRHTLSAAAGAVLAISFVYTPAEMPKLGLCLFRKLTQLPCPGCGMTRAFCAISHGEFAAAWGFHPFGFGIYALTVALLLWPWIANSRPELERRIFASRVTALAGVAFIAGIFVFGGMRIWGLVHAS